MNKRCFQRIIGAVLIAAVMLLFPVAVQRLDAGRAEVGRQQLEDALHRAVAACYATEGFYPPTVDYLRQHYGLQIDESRYLVFYEVFAENLMPEITVLLK